ncbi:uncharacterized protein I303_100344 [Kwoniella dejecticola CBS 10117]|uniref:Uncharacterized protein n=1 Tax=Kwoniella dejecticola CBS 10117 TaxID=1296121 RepID=A0A1A6AEM9_9TREE|nr:uncharacterized protein I303_00344 [Kwoniella dejecticola CBS 10117]OBR88527.1 hypothetical protein I303_00344 [Kwoniella dejecticola CBS 10117]
MANIETNIPKSHADDNDDDKSIPTITTPPGATTAPKSRANEPSGMASMLPMIMPMAILGFIFALANQSKIGKVQRDVKELKEVIRLLQQEISSMRGDA